MLQYCVQFTSIVRTVRANENSLFNFEAKKMAKNKNLKRKAAPVVKKAHNEWLDETIEPSEDEEVCSCLFTVVMSSVFVL